MGVASPGKEHEIFTVWAQEQGVEINGIGPSRIPGRGLGVVARRRLEKGERLVFVPAAAIIKLDSDIVKSRNLPVSCTVHGRLAASLTLGSTNPDSYYKSWEATWPKMRDFEESMPILWPDELSRHLPAPAKELLAKQRMKLEKDWKALQAFLPSTSQDLFTYYWLVVNTRTFYWDYSIAPARRRAKKGRGCVADDCMALCPFADYFNHADDGCALSSGGGGYGVTSDRDYGTTDLHHSMRLLHDECADAGLEPGEEIHVTYGSHSNDFLLVEYGFILDKNRWDTTKLDHLILAQLSQHLRAMLDETDFLGDYILDAAGICYRSQAAIRAIILPPGRFRRFLSCADDGDHDKAEVDYRCVEVLVHFRREIDEMLKSLKALGRSAQRETLLLRWQQIRELVNAQIARSTWWKSLTPST